MIIDADASTDTETLKTVSETQTDDDGISEEPKHDASSNGEYPKQFDAFWDSCTHKVGKAATYRQWRQRIRDGTSAEELIAGAKGYYDFCRRENRESRHTKHPATLIGRDEHWKDYLPNSDTILESNGQCPVCGMTDSRHKIDCKAIAHVPWAGRGSA